DNKTLAAGGGNPACYAMNLWDIATGKEICSIKENNRIDSMSFSQDSKILAQAIYGKDALGRFTPGNLVRFWNVANGEAIRSWPLGSRAYHEVKTCFSTDCKILMGSGYDGKDNNRLRIWDLSTGKEIHSWKTGSCVFSECFSSDNK